MLFVQLLLVAVVAVSANEPGCGRRPFAATSRIVNGVEATVGDWGWQVSLTQYGQHFCGGVLINKQWVLSAAHCFMNGVPSTLRIDLGLHNKANKESTTVSRGASRVISHENWNGRTMRNDISLIKLDAPVEYNDYIIPACMPATGLDVTGKNGWVSGWGSTRLGGSTVSRLMEDVMPILSVDRCKARYGSLVDRVSTVCAGEFNINGGACQGDSGGPFVVQNNLGQWDIVGLVSFGTNGCGYGTVFTRVSYFLNWINQKMATN
jgi:secreted trypsin-like serine protease